MNSKPLILIVDDDAELSGMVVELLQREGWATHAVLTGGDGERDLAALHPEIVLLDVMLPDANGYDLCRRWRAQYPALGVVMLTARGDPLDRVLGLEIGADDYLAKPFESRELVARVQALARRGRAVRSRLIEHGPLTIDLAKKRALVNGVPLDLSQREHAILEYLFSNIEAIVPKDKIASAVASWDEHMSANAIEVHISRLRAKLEPTGIRIRTIRGLGYLVEAWSDAKP